MTARTTDGENEQKAEYITRITAADIKKNLFFLPPNNFNKNERA